MHQLVLEIYATAGQDVRRRIRQSSASAVSLDPSELDS
ncbi:hypothetical protein AWB76_06796 [Caballeronia temeraria]|uniref:Uncharacterized protein n=1 Tax=Caballeronia temeraria TaxID=1777137 RepID=A0A158DC74_9BURK|nr:hypothetical protein AWB76_06796 [Caballeronia temeraria]